MNPMKRLRTGSRHLSERTKEPRTSKQVSINIGNGCGILVEYFLHIAHVTGIHDDFQVMSEAWTITVRVLKGSGALADLCGDPPSSLKQEPALPRKYKAVVVAACALAVDVCGDFEASFAHSAVAWGTFFIEQIQDSTKNRTPESDCLQLMRMKMITGRALRWDIGFDNPATLFCRTLFCLRDNTECTVCRDLSAKLSRLQTSTLQGISFLLSTRGDSSAVIALVAVLFLHSPQRVNQIPTPLRNEMYLVPTCLSRLLTQEITLQILNDSAAYVHRNWDYVQNLISETFNPRNTSARTLSMIENEYFRDSSGDVVSPSLN